MTGTTSTEQPRTPTIGEIEMAEEWIYRCGRIQEIMEQAGLRNPNADVQFDAKGRFGILVTWDWNRGTKRKAKK